MNQVFFKRSRSFAAPALLMVFSLLVAGCKSEPPPPPLPQMTFTRYQPIYLAVANIDIVEEYKQPQREPYVEHLLSLSPAEAMRIWVKDRLKSAGQDKSLQIVIKDASVISHPQDSQDTLLGPAPNRRYDARIDVDMRVYGSDAMSEANINVIATQTITVSDSASLDERNRIFYRMIYDLMESANAELEKQVFTYFPKYIIYAQTP
jgi:hypothetical protein